MTKGILFDFAYRWAKIEYKWKIIAEDKIEFQTLRYSAFEIQCSLLICILIMGNHQSLTKILTGVVREEIAPSK